MCEASLPTELQNKLEDVEKDNQPAVGADWAKEQVKELVKEGAPGFHLYALNQSEASLQILEWLKK